MLLDFFNLNIVMFSLKHVEKVPSSVKIGRKYLEGLHEYVHIFVTTLVIDMV